MSFSIQTPVNSIIGAGLFLGEAEEATQEQQLDSTLPDKPEGRLQTGSRSFFFKASPEFPLAKEILQCALQMTFVMGNKMAQSEKPSLMSLTTASAYRPQSQKSPIGQPLLRASTPAQGKVENRAQPTQTGTRTQTPQPTERKSAEKSPSPSITVKQPTSHSKEAVRAETRRQEGQERKNGKEGTDSLSSYRWSKEETREWWETRYHQRERQGGDQQKRDQQEQQEQEENPLKVAKGGFYASKKNGTPLGMKESSGKVRKPELAPPKMGVFALYYLLTKMGIYSDGASNFSYKKEIEFVDGESTETHKKRLDEMKEAIAKEQENARWGVATKVFSWIGSIMAIVVGVVLIATGVGAVAGAMAIAGGLIQITNQILEMTGGWKKIAELLPGDDSEKKGAVIAWMQLGIAVLCLILTGVGAIWGGISNFGEAMSSITGIIGSIAGMAQGITTIGAGVSSFMFSNHMSEVKRYEVRIAQLKHLRKDLMEKVEDGVDRLEQLFENLARALEFDEELFYADQMLYRR